jgi:short-subunit dehydrogenase
LYPFAPWRGKNAGNQKFQSLFNYNSALTNSLPGKGTAHAIPADFYKHEDCKKLATELSKRESKLDVLVNNSGSNWGAPFDEVLPPLTI